MKKKKTKVNEEQKDLVERHHCSCCTLLMPPLPHLAHGGVLLPQAHDDDAVGLTDAALCPGGEAAVALVQHDAVEVLLLAQPAGQSVLMDAAHQ